MAVDELMWESPATSSKEMEGLTSTPAKWGKSLDRRISALHKTEIPAMGISPLRRRCRENFEVGKSTMLI